MYDYANSENLEACTDACKAYCCLYEGEMALYDNINYVTISPNPKDYPDRKHLLDDWQEKFIKLLPSYSKSLIVLELAGGLRPHYHCIFDVTDNIKFTATLYKWSIYHNVKIHGKFKSGLHYMFKSVDETYRATGQIPIIEYEDYTAILRLRQDRKAEEKERQKALNMNDINASIPVWMLNK